MFSNSVVNTGRQVALDYAKGIAVVCMVICHTVMYFCADNRDNNWFYVADQILGGPTVAPLFMICLGIGICFSRNTTPQYLVKRGILLLLGGYGLNLVRGGAFAIAGGLLEGWHDNCYGVDFGELSFFANFIVDILQFAGLAFLFMALALKLKLNNKVLAALAILLPLVGHFFIGMDCGNRYVNALLGLFVPTGVISDEDCVACFPLTIWILYPIVGYLFGQYLRRAEDVDQLYRYLFGPCTAVSFVYIVVIIVCGAHPLSRSYYWHTLPNAFFYICLDLTVISGMHLLSKWVPEKLDWFLCGLSRNLTRVYCVSWTLIVWTMIPYELIVGTRNVDASMAYLFGFVILILSCWIERTSRMRGWV